MANGNASVFLYVPAQFIGGFKKEIVLPFPFPPYVKAVCGTLGGAISCITCTCKKHLRAHVFICFHSQTSLSVQIQAEKANLKLFLF